MSTESADRRGHAQRLNVTVKAETHDRLQAARNRKGIDINVSAVADAAINAELDRLEKPDTADLVARLRVERRQRRGRPYSLGYIAGTSWARETASWVEICKYAALTSDSVETGWITFDEDAYLVFKDAFRPPHDYSNYTPSEPGAPAYFDPENTEGSDPWVTTAPVCDQFWRGWLAAVHEIFNLVKDELVPIVDDVDPEEIPEIPF